MREQKALTWENAVRKMSGLPAAIMGLADRGLIAPGMFADIAVFDTAAVIDHATYEKSDALSDGIRVVLVNGVVALEDGKVTGARGGRALRRSAHEPSRLQRLTMARRVTAEGTLDASDGPRAVSVSLSQTAGATAATGSVRLTGGGVTLQSVSLGTLQVAPRWASVTGIARISGATDLDGERAFTLIVDAADPMAAGATTMELRLEGLAPSRGKLSRAARVLP